jgi:hypothetical protein
LKDRRLPLNKRIPLFNDYSPLLVEATFSGQILEKEGPEARFL